MRNYLPPSSAPRPDPAEPFRFPRELPVPCRSAQPRSGGSVCCAVLLPGPVQLACRVRGEHNRRQERFVRAAL